MPSHLNRHHFQIEYETQFQDGQEVTLVSLFGELSDITFDDAQEALMSLVEAGHRHWRLDLKDLYLKNAGASLLCSLSIHIRRHGGSLVLLNVNRRQQEKLGGFPISRFATIEPLPGEDL